jgi:C1q domain
MKKLASLLAPLFFVTGITAQIVTSPTLSTSTTVVSSAIAFKANATYVGGTVLDNNRSSLVNFTGVVFDEGNNFSKDNDVFLVPSDGIYHFDVRVSWLQFTAPGSVTINLNTAPLATPATSILIASTTLRTFDSNLNTLLKLKAGDKIFVYVKQESGTTQKYQQVQLCGFKVK